MRPRRLPIISTLMAGYRNLGRLLSEMPMLMLCAFLIMLATSVAGDLVPGRLWDQQLTGEALGLAQNAVEAFLLTPIALAIHRFVILNQITPTYTIAIGEPVFGVFFGWLLVFKILLGLPLDLLGLLQTLDWSLPASTTAFAIALIAAIGVLPRLTIMFPALAVGANGATPSHALADTKGYVFRILALFFLTLALWSVAALGGVLLLGRGAMITGSPRAMLALLMGGVLQTITFALAAIMASLVFKALGTQAMRAATLRARA